MAFGDRIKRTKVESGVSPHVPDLGSNPASGNLLILTMGCRESSGSIFTDPTGFTRIEAYEDNSPTAEGAGCWWYKISDGTEQTVSVVLPDLQTNITNYVEFEWDGSTPTVTSNEDLTEINNPSSTSCVTGAVTPGQSTNICLVVVGNEDRDTDAGGAWDGSWSEFETTYDTSNNRGEVTSMGKVVSVSGSQSGQYTHTDSGGSQWGSIACFDVGAAGRTVNCTTEILELAENAAAVNRQRGVTTLTEVLELGENAAAVNRTRLVTALTEILQLAENAAAVNRTRLVTALTEVLELAENIATVIRGGGRIVNCTTEILQLAENVAAVNRQRGVTTLTEVLELGENAAAINRQRGVNAATEVLLLSTVQASVNASRIVLGLVEALQLAENNASVNRTRLVTTLTEILELAENTANVIRGGGRLVNCVTEALLLATNAAAINRQRGVTTLTEILELTENAATVNKQRGVIAATETLLLSTVQASVNASRSVIGLVESLLLTEQSATVSGSRIVAALTEALLLATNQANVITGVLAKFIDYKFVKGALPRSDRTTTPATQDTVQVDPKATTKVAD